MGETASGVRVRGTTRGLPPGADYDHFCSSLADVYVGVQPRRPRLGSFDADFSLYRTGATDVGMISTPGVDARRDRASIARVPDDAVFINHSLKPWGLSQRGRTWDVAARSATVLENGLPFDVLADKRRRLDLVTVRIPREHLSPRTLRALPSLGDRLARTPLGAQLGTQVGLLAQAAKADLARVATSMSSCVIDLLDAFAADDRDPSAPVRAHALRTYARTRLADPHFDLAAAARAFGCTPRTIQNAFAQDGDTFSGWLRAERLDRAREELRTTGRGRSVAAIARSNGFADAGTFHRAYRERFGTTPGANR
ncbi:AraC family transcriptional regulator [Microbacterium sp. BG28]|uniref:AraC family transcriptional regulator n=1 Tax=Microbacterium sp. BG28 TaxID=3097356 RepID=UPI002A5A2804|nr:AraC family transcriptional regulator [Microbacterium sp. BG28]MDY0827848.1 AraC family transcriptional regulator [Microbacterium sp. BG28]